MKLKGVDMHITEDAPPQVGRAIRLPAVCDLTGASRGTIWRWVKEDPSFPKPFHLSPAVTCWDEKELLAWIDEKKAQRAL